MSRRNTTLLNRFFKWFKYSGIWITFTLNPLHWRFSFMLVKKDSLSGRDYIDADFLFLNIRIIIDNGDW